jgi:hypothetical protein
MKPIAKRTAIVLHVCGPFIEYHAAFAKKEQGQNAAQGLKKKKKRKERKKEL